MSMRRMYSNIGLVILMGARMSAQAQGLAAVDVWLRSQITGDAASQAAKKKPTQTQSIAIDHGSTSFVDTTSGTDLVGAALNLVPVGAGNSPSGTTTSPTTGGAGTVSASLYSLYTMAARLDPLRPSVYNEDSSQNLRSVYLTVGRVDKSQDPSKTTTQNPGTVYGTRVLLFNRRDASTIKNSTDFQENMRAALTSLAGDVASSSFDIASILTKALAPGKTMVQYLTDSITSPDDVGAAVKKLSSSDRDRIDQIVSQFKRNKDQIDTAISSLVESLKRRPQFSVAFQTIQRSGGSNNDYRAVLIYDQAISSRLFAAVNGSWDYSDSSKIGADVRGGRAAVEFRYSLTRVSGVSVRTPLDLALSGEGVRGNGDYQYRAQLQLSIPIAAGVTIPVSFGYGNRSEILRTQEKGVYGKFGLTLDVAKLANALLRSSQ